MPNEIIVIGSINTDMVIKAQTFPLPGETLLGGDFFMFPGGKGANQAVAAARLGGQVAFVARIGNDVFGKQSLSQFGKEGIQTRYISTDPEAPSGVALITVDAKGENTIVVAPGANNRLSESDVDRALADLSDVDVALLQLEIPLATAIYAIQRLGEAGKRVILNPAPAQRLPDDLFAHLYLITPNQTEAQILTGVRVTDEASALQAASVLRQKGVQQVVLTMGSVGAFVLTEAGHVLLPAPVVEAVDTTAAGDVFNGALAVAVADGVPIEQAVTYACQAAAVSVTRLGAQASAPYRGEVPLPVNS